ncbi:hypothetical protein ACP4OV_019852 [Aristida adscensionis]
MANDNHRVFLVLLLVAMAASTVQGRPGPAPAAVVESTPACCLYNADCCQEVAARGGIGAVVYKPLSP